MTDITPFDFNGNPVRIVMIDGDPWFVASDVATALGYANPRKALADHVDAEDRGVTIGDTPGGRQEMTTINESGLYALIFGSTLPAARTFKRWVTAEVLPALRRTGTYAVQVAPPGDALDLAEQMIAAIRADRERMTAIEGRQVAIEARIEAVEGNSGWVAAMGWAKVNGLQVTDNVTMSRLGKRASKIMREMGLPIRKTSHQYLGEVNLYPEGVLAKAAEQLDLI